MPKRSYAEKMERYNYKIRRLEEKENKRRRRIIESSDSLEENSDNESQAVLEDPMPMECSLENIHESLAPEKVPEEENSQEVISLPDLDPDILSALGEVAEDVPKFGEKIHDNLSRLWHPILRKGIEKEAKDKLMKQYQIPENCTLLQAPKLNPEIAATLSDTTRNKDKRVESAQQQLGLGITALNKGLSLLLENGTERVKAIKFLSDSSRILCDLHHVETEVRKKFMTPGLDKTFLNLIQDVERDETLFGQKLSDKIKASKAIEKQGLQIKKQAPVKTPAASAQPSTSRIRSQVNWFGPSRYASNRGGAGWLQEDRISRPQRSPSVNDETTVVIAASTEPDQVTCSGPTALETATPTVQEPYPGSRDALRIAFIRRNIPTVALELMLSSVSNNTLKQYNTSYKLWWEFCNTNDISIFNPQLADILTFLTQQFHRGGSYGTINSHRSALSLLLGGNIGSDDSVKRLLKGIFKQKPCIPKYIGTWDPQIVLNHVANWFPNRSLPLDKITKKVCVLLAICTAHRVQTLSLIKVSNINKGTDALQIPITDFVKTSGVGRDQPVLILPYFRENPRICPATAVDDYLFMTSSLRPDNLDHLFMTYKRPHKKASSQSISRWIKQTLAESGVDVGMFSAHSTRHASTSAAASAGVSIDIIRKTAGWSSSSRTFARFYNRPVLDEGIFARSVFSLPNEH